MRIELPANFLWGAALSSYQTEGGNLNTDWAEWEHRLTQECGQACNHYALYKQDFDLARSLNLNSVRISLEWARIFPAPGVCCEEVLGHYSDVLDSLRVRNLSPLVTLHHFTNPVWFAQNHGWHSTAQCGHFLQYLSRAVQAFCDKVDYWIILNEPLVYIYNGYIRGVWPPGLTSFNDARKALKNMTSVYLEGYQEIHRIYKNSRRVPRVSISQHLRFFSPCTQGVRFLNNISAQFRHTMFNMALLEYLTKKRALDFIGVNYYCKEYVRFKGIVGRECTQPHHTDRKNYPQWYVDAHAFYELLMGLKRFHTPVIVTENGSAEESDQMYRDYLLTHLQAVARALSQGVPIAGYFWWSLLDNFEWDKGFDCRFGLAEVDYRNFSRKLRPYALTYAKICKENAIEID